MARRELTEPGDWHFQPLEDLDQLLRCPICFEYYEATMMFPQCSHNFCSLCIRRYLSAGNTKCPMCAKFVTEGDLKNNRLVDQLVQHFKSSRRALLSLVQSRGDHHAKGTVTKKEGVKTKCQETSSSPTANTRCGRHGKGRLYSVPEAPNLPDSEAFVEDIISSSAAVSRCEDGEEGRREDGNLSDTADVAQSPSFLSPWQPEDVRERKRPQLFGDLGEIGEMRKKRGKGKLRHFSTSSTPSRLHNDIAPSTSSPLLLPSPLLNCSPSLNHNSSIAATKTENSPCSDKAACPVCDQLVSVRFINGHLDGCLKIPDTSYSQTQRKYAKIPRLVYQIMKDRQLKSKLKEYHLPIHGDRQMLIGRLKEFILRFNAQCDSLNPRPPKEVAMEIEQEERARQASSKQTQQSPVTRGKREMTVEEIEKEKKYYEERHKDQFSELIVQARDQMREEREGYCERQRELEVDEEERGETGEGERGSNQVSDLCCDTPDDDGGVLAKASPDPDLTPPLASSYRSSHSVPESPPHSGDGSALLRGKRCRQSTPSPTLSLSASPTPSLVEWNDEEFIPNAAHYRTPSASSSSRRSSRTASKRPRR